MIKNFNLKENIILCHTIGLKNLQAKDGIDFYQNCVHQFENYFIEYDNIFQIFNISYDFIGTKSEVLWPNIPATEERINEILEEFKKQKENGLG